MMHPAVAKATKVGNLAVEYGWKGRLDSDVENRARRTVFNLERDGKECLELIWINQNLTSAIYWLTFDGERMVLRTNNQVRFAVTQEWKPDLTNYPRVGDKFDNQGIMHHLRGRDVFWWEHRSAQVRHEHILFKQNSQYRIQEIGHRKLLWFKTTDGIMLTFFVDAILKVI